MNNKKITVGFGSCGIAAGAQDVFNSIEKVLKDKNLNVELNKTGCNGLCYCEPIIEVRNENGLTIYHSVNPSKVEKIIEEHIVNNNEIDAWKIDIEQEKNTGVLAKQVRIVLRNCGTINPEDIDEYIARDGYRAIEKVIKNYSSEKLIEEIIKSGLRGRGGGGFSTGMKWNFGYQAKGDKKYLICNADEGDPGAFMDRGILESDPHNVLEGMIIAAYAIGAQEGYVYCRAEYPLAIHRLKIAIKQAEEKNLLGNNILGSDFSFIIKIKEGAGAFVCGEETALIHSIEGQRGMPRKRPPFPAHKGLWEYPTIINNVETLANVAWIILNGAEEYAKLGTGKSKGTKVFALAGDINHGGLVEVPMGIPIKDIIFGIGGGIPGNKKLKAVQIGGPSGGCLPAELLDTKVDYDSVIKTGAIMGSGGLVVMDEKSCMVDVAKFFLNFTQNESCGKCTFCRIGTKRMLELLEKITKGDGHPKDIELLDELAKNITETSLCGLGQSAPNPVLTTIKYFKEEYMKHILDNKCPAGKCQDLISYSIIPKNCIGCTACVRVCPVDAISGEKKQVHLIDQEKCTKCGNCVEKCKFQAIKVG
jgi:NADH-quinone oxidoreductase subunit F